MPQWIEISIRTLTAVVVLFVMTKLLGKRQISQLSLFEYITGITIGSLAAYISLDLESNWYLGIVSLGVWIAVSLLMEWVTVKNRTLRKWIDGKSTVLIKEGKVLENNLKKERISIDELLDQLRQKHAHRIADVEFAVIEPSGEVNVMLKKEHQPLTAKHLGITVGPEREPQTVIMDGQILEEPLATQGLSREWLQAELEKIGVTVENVFIGQVDSYGQFYVDLYDDQLKVPAPQSKALLLSVLKKCEADLELFGLGTQNKQAKAMYEQCSKSLQETILQLKPLLIR